MSTVKRELKSIRRLFQSNILIKEGEVTEKGAMMHECRLFFAWDWQSELHTKTGRIE